MYQPEPAKIHDELINHAPGALIQVNCGIKGKLVIEPNLELVFSERVFLYIPCVCMGAAEFSYCFRDRRFQGRRLGNKTGQ